MLYDSYKKKITKLMKIRHFIKKHIIIFTTSFSLFFVSLGTFLGTYGMIINDINDTLTISYGDEVNTNTKSLFNKINYEFRNKGEETWYAEQPILPGTYEVRTFAHRMFGVTQYGNTQDLVITKRKVDVKSNVTELPYGDKLTGTADLIEGHFIKNIKFNNLSVSKTETNVIPELSSIIIYDSNNQDVTENYEFNPIESNVKFVKRNIEFTTSSYNYQYDRNEAVFDEYTISNGDFAYNDYAVASFEDSNLIDLGTTKNKASFNIYDENNLDVTENYNITIKYGDLNVVPRDLEITTGSKEYTYSGKEYYFNEVESSNGLLSDDEILIDEYSSFINAGEHENVFKCHINDKNNTDISKYYNITFVNGIVKINPKPITVESVSKSKDYDSTKLSCDEYQITKGKLVDGHKEVVEFKNSITNVGSIENEISVIIKDAKDVDITYNYAIETKYGTLEIGKRKAIITSGSSEKEYDGKNFSNEDFSCENLIDGQYIKVVKVTIVKDAGIYENILKYKIFDKNDIEITNNYTIEDVYGSLTINKKDLELISSSKEKIYDGTELIGGDYDSVKGLLTTHKIKIGKDLKTITNYGTIENSYTYNVIDNNGVNYTKNYNLINTWGNLTIKKRTITISTDNASKVYDTKPLNKEGFYLDKGDKYNLLENHEIKITSDYSSLINAKKIDNEFDFIIVDNDGNDVTNNYDFILDWGKLEVKPRPINIKTNSASKIYDNTSLKTEGFEYQEEGVDEGLINEHKITITGNWLEIIDAQIIDNSIDFKIVDNSDNDLTSNYLLNCEWGKLEIIPRPVTLSTDGYKKVYDNLPVKIEGYRLSEYGLNTGILPDHKFNMVGEYTTFLDVVDDYNTIQYEVKFNKSDVTNNYDFILDWGKIDILPRPITITTESLTKTYDDVLMDCKKYDYTKYGKDVGLLPNQTLSLASEWLSIINADCVDNKIIVKIIDDKTSLVTTWNYDITYNYGKLEILPRPLEISTESITKIYDDEFIQSNNYSYTKLGLNEGLLSTHKINLLSKYIKIKNVGEYINKFDYVILNDKNIDVTDNYEITEKWGKFIINPRPITIETGSLNKEYDGISTFVKDYKIIEGTLVDTHSLISIDKEWKAFEDVGEFENKCKFNILNKNNESVIDNYEIKYVWGKVVINPKKIIVKTGNGEKIYDDKIFENNEFTVIDGNILKNHILYVSEYCSFVDAGEYENTPEFKIKDENNIDKTKNYIIEIESGIITIYPRKLVVSSETLDVMYDGNSHTLPGMNVIDIGENSGLVYGHKIEETGEWKNYIDTYEGFNSVTYEIVREDGSNVSRNYEIEECWGNYRIVPIPIKVITESNTKKYDGKPFSKPGFNITYGKCILDHKIEANNPWIEVTNAGEYKNVNEFIVVDSNGDDLTHNYDIIFVPGYLKIIGIYINIKTESAYKIYDGKPLTCNKFKYTEDVLLPGHNIVSNITGSQTKIGFSENKGEFKIVQGDIDQTPNYVITVEFGILEIRSNDNKITLDIAPLNVKKEYDGTPLYAANKIDFYESSEILQELYQKGYRYKVKVDGERTTKGVSECKISSFNLYDENGKDVTSDYNLNFKKGKIEVAGIELKVFTGSFKKEYDGTELMVPTGYTHDCPHLMSGHTIIVTVTGRITNPGIVTNTADIRVIDQFGTVVTELYDIVRDFGDLKIYLPNESKMDGTGFLMDAEDASQLSSHAFGSGGSDLTKKKAGDLDDEKHTFYAIDETSSNLYLKQMSFGDYKLNSYGPAKEYKNPKYNINPMYLAGLALKESGYDSYEIEFFMPNGNKGLMPYYSFEGPELPNDFKVDINYDKSFKFNYVPYTYSPYDDITLEGTEYEEFEKDYYEFVKANYLQLPMTTKEGMLQIANSNHLYADNVDIINEVASYIQDSAYYTFNFPTFPFDEDFALYFLNESKRGVCQHYATAAVCMYRALGIPARYTVGYTTKTRAYEISDINILMGHAWVEVYVKGFGWIQVEATGGGFAGFDMDPEIIGKPKLSVKPLDIDKGYDGTPLFAKNKIQYTAGVKKLLQNGCTYKVVCEGQQTEIGTGESRIVSFSLFDKIGRDITHEYDIIYKTGKITITKQQIILIAHNYQKYYDGIGFTATKDDVTIIGGDGLNISFDVSGEVKRTGTKKIKIKNVTVKDNNGNDVIDNYYLKIIEGRIQINKLPLTINSKSASKQYDGKPLECKEYWISYGELLPKHMLFVEMDTKTNEIGSIDNEFKTIRVQDENGKDVTFAYDIQEVLGKLEITI